MQYLTAAIDNSKEEREVESTYAKIFRIGPLLKEKIEVEFN